MRRQYSNSATEAVRSLLGLLVGDADATTYRDAMTRLGAELGTVAARKLGLSGKCLLICTNEDADFIARGLLDALARQGMEDVRVACFWNARVRSSTTGID